MAQRVASGSGGNRLTPRERQVLWLMADGATGIQIAQALGISEATVHKHVTSLKSRLGATTRAQATALALRDGVLPTAVLGERFYIHEAVRDGADRIGDSRLTYIAHESRLRDPEVMRHVGRPVTTWHPKWPSTPAFATLCEVLESQRVQEIARLKMRLPWEPRAYEVDARLEPLGPDHVAIRMLDSPA